MDVYGVLHEADPSKAVAVFDQIMARKEVTNILTAIIAVFIIRRTDKELDSDDGAISAAS